MPRFIRRWQKHREDGTERPDSDRVISSISSKSDRVADEVKIRVDGQLLRIKLDILDRVEFGAFRRQWNDADILWHFELFGHVSPDFLHQHNAVCTWFDSERHLRQVQRHGLGVAEREDQACSLAKLRADGAEDVS
ncbi:hypothetical protein [Sphingobium yanoikuyae]|uniref:hypothetical protein n=1 Tax=Sphingobium yanoikuyae TaxID=13690 RepID=UPI00241CB374|nr:hypothetical protein [Sphingobium yanoikuyae]